MTTTPQAFEAGLAACKQEQNSPWGRLRYEISSANLRRHLARGSLRFLDAGGGNGLGAIPFAAQGHPVTLVDFSSQMLAEARRNAQAHGVAERLTCLQADVAAIPTLFPESAFDVVLCHNVIQYVDDVKTTLEILCRTLRPGGLISVMSINPYSETYRMTYRDLDLAAAYASLDATGFRTLIFDVDVHYYRSEDVCQRLSDGACSVVGDYGIRCVCDYIVDNDIKYDPIFFSHLERLEYALTDRLPFKQLARFYQVIARKMDA